MENAKINPDEFAYIVDCMSEEDLLCQLAEEASELAQAALKVCRAINGRNPTPVTRSDAMENLREEIADVWLALLTLGLAEEPKEKNPYLATMARKTERWAKRLDWEINDDGIL